MVRPSQRGGNWCWDCKKWFCSRGKGGERGGEGNQRGEGVGRGGQSVGAVTLNVGHCALAGSQAAKPWQLVSLCVTDLIDHKPFLPPPPSPTPHPTLDPGWAVAARSLQGQHR